MLVGQDSKDKYKGGFSRTAEEYASSTTIHGIAYCFDLGKWKIDRALWFIIVLAAIAFAAYTTLIVLEETDPILTAVETAGLPIEDIMFPSITICPQGSVNEIIDAAFFKQFDDYLNSKSLHHPRSKRENLENLPTLGASEIHKEGGNFLAEKYPGAKLLPLEMIQILGSPKLDTDKFLENEAILNFEDDNSGCLLTGIPVARVILSINSNYKSNITNKICVGSAGDVRWDLPCDNIESQTLTLEVVPGLRIGSVVFKSYLGTYFSVEDDGVIKANSTEVENAEMFTMAWQQYGYSIQSLRSNQFLSANHSDGGLILTKSEQGDLGIFRITDKTKGKLCLGAVFHNSAYAVCLN